ncbi:NADP-dependent oxidoreductase [Nonomuraea guangzhouensis]|uniref:NADP-dependent oxidoreductase n=1 Tax=Nonomuraea guangzhouensis TaxID=1291555 RepID=A0ABW4GEC4_9ACTN|nr:NADP-dependent oxidoreductase [Nonomuraea guangzhouensis]
MSGQIEVVMNTTRGVLIDGYGPPEVLRIGRVPLPEPGYGEVQVRVHAAGINAIDWLTRAGRGLSLSSFPAVLGWDISGTVSQIGPGVTTLKTGDQVFGMPYFPDLAGGYADHVTAPADSLAVKPDGIPHHSAAGAPMPALTAWQALFDVGRLSPGQRVLIHGAAGGVGHVAVQLAVNAGAEVIGTASAGNRAFVEGLGAHEVIDYSTSPVEKVARDIDMAVDPRGGQEALRLLDVLRPGGILVTLKGASAQLTEAVRARGLRVGFVYVAPDGAALADLAALMAVGHLRIAVENVFPLNEVSAAHMIGETGHVRGRLVLDTT